MVAQRRHAYIKANQTVRQKRSIGPVVPKRQIPGERTIDAHDLYENDGMHYLTRRPDEIRSKYSTDAAAS